MNPIEDKVIIIQDEGEKEIGGLVLPDSAVKKPKSGRVIVSGAGRYTDNGVFIPNKSKPGDRVLYGDFDTSEFDHEGQTYVIIRESKIHVIL